MVVHFNSIKSHNEFVMEGKKETWRRGVFLIYASNPEKSFTDREVIEMLGSNDFNQVRPRITELIKDGLLLEVDKKTCIYTKKTVRAVKWAGKPYKSKGA